MEAKARSGLKEVLEEVVDELVRKGILWPEASAQFEKLFILRVLAESKGNMSRAAEIMGVHRNTLSKKLREHQIQRLAVAKVGSPSGSPSPKVRSGRKRAERHRAPAS